MSNTTPRSALWLCLLLSFGTLPLLAACGDDDSGDDDTADGDADADADVDADADADADADGDGDGDLCETTCEYDGDGACDDGGQDSDFSVCDYGTDCTDCGPRDPDACPAYCGEEGAEYECGDDGCGGVCGTCADGQVCDFLGACCTPDCTGKVCGDDGCGGTCGAECGDTQFCNETQTACEECSCGAKVCGYDQCFNACGQNDGQCGDAQYCDDAGACQACDCGARVCGFNDNFCDCGTCADNQFCDNAGACQPCTCEGKTCGDDGCGTSCGDCTDPQLCDNLLHSCVDPGSLCSNTCAYPGDGDCDDGGLNCDYSLCEFGSDCADCGQRTEDQRLPDGETCSGGGDA